MAYDESSIRHEQGLSYVRLRPTMYVIDTAIQGQIHCAIEIIHNSLDETSLMSGQGCITIVFIPDPARKTYQLIIRDNGRGIPHTKLLSCYTELMVSGKYDTTSYVVSSGMFGVGSKAAAALSNKFVGITEREGKLSKILVERGETKQTIVEETCGTNITGTTVMYEPDDSIMGDIEEFCTVGYDALLELCKKFCVFGNTRIIFKVGNKAITKKIWEGSAVDTQLAINKCVETSQGVFDSITDIINPEDFLKKYWEIDRPFAWNYVYVKPITSIPIKIVVDRRTEETTDGTLIYGFNLRSYYVRFNTSGGAMGMVNNVPIDHGASVHIRTINEVYKAALADHIDTPQIREFFLTQYRLPLFHAVDVRRSGATFTGTTKHAFYDKTFEPVYRKDLEDMLSTPEAQVSIETLFNFMYPDIEAKYQALQGNPLVGKDLGKLFQKLNRDKFNDCETTDRSITELFLVEGDSAGNKENMNRVFQANYQLSGKPFNGLVRQELTKKSAEDIRKSPLYQDIFTIMNINPNKPDFNALNFSKLVLMADADSHGYHINSLLLSNLFVACPEMIERGIVHVLLPPLYQVKLNNNSIYVRDAKSMIEWRSMYVYKPSLEIILYPKTPVKGVAPGRILDIDEYVDFAQRVTIAGEAMERVAEAFAIDPRIVEYLAFIADKIVNDRLDTKALHNNIFEGCSFKYEDGTNSLLLITPERDIFIPLTGLKEQLEKLVIPHLDRLLWRDISYHVSTVYTDYAKNKPMLISEIYGLFKTLNDSFSTKRYKGLGSMSADSLKEICYGTDKRQLYQITQIGDVERIFELLGKDPAHRKKLVEIEDV